MSETNYPKFFAGTTDYSPDEVINQVNNALEHYNLRCHPIGDDDEEEDSGYGHYEIRPYDKK
jgi:hypothetical protein